MRKEEPSDSNVCGESGINFGISGIQSQPLVIQNNRIRNRLKY